MAPDSVAARARRSVVVAVFAVVSLLTVIGCGDSSGQGSESAAVPAPSTTVASPSTTAARSTTAAPTTAPPTTTAAPTTAAAAPTTTTAAATTTVPPEPPTVLLVGDSTLLAVESYGTEAAFTGFQPVLEVKSCRTLGIPSCGDPPVPPNSVEAIDASAGPFDGVVIMAGYDEWWTSFPTSLEAVVASSRARGAEWILWLDYPEDVTYRLPDGRTADESFVANNEALRQYAGAPGFTDLVLAGWSTYAGRTDEWMSPDGIHLSVVGAYGVADYISRWVAHLNGTACPQPLTAGGPIASPCGSPDELETGPDLDALYLADTGG